MNEINLNLLPVSLDEVINFPESFYENTLIKRLEGIHVKGIIKYNLSDEVELDLQVTGNMILNDAITLEEVAYPLDIHISGLLADYLEENGNYLEKNQNILDKLEFLWENIVLEVPISFTKQSGVKLSGNGWELNSDKKEDDIDPRLAKLNDLFKGGE